MRMIRFARHHHPKDETRCAESFLVPDCRLAVKADDVEQLSGDEPAEADVYSFS
jgi:hypothetical protein